MFSEILQNCKYSKPKVIVIYDENVTQKLHPLPGIVAINRHDDQLIVESDLSLRKQISSPAAPYSKAIKEHENMFAYYPDDITKDQIEKYFEIVSVAETPLLRDAEVVLCTCGASGSAKIVKHCNIQQVCVSLFLQNVTLLACLYECTGRAIALPQVSKLALVLV